jgi:hypothetical protein
MADKHRLKNVTECVAFFTQIGDEGEPKPLKELPLQDRRDARKIAVNLIELVDALLLPVRK